MAAPKDKQFLFDWPQDTEASPDKEDVASVELNREAESRLRAATAELAEAPTDPELLLNTALAALLEEQPELSLRYQHRFSKRYAAMVAEDQLLRAVALAQQGRWPQAAQVVRQHRRRRTTWLNLVLARWLDADDLVPPLAQENRSGAAKERR